MEFNILYSKNDRKFNSKPDDIVTGTLRFEPIRTDINDLINHLTQGKSISGSLYRNHHRDTKNFITQQIFGVDFDGTITLDEVNAIVEDFGIMYNFGHYTFRHTAVEERFRIYFVMDGEVQDPKLAKHIAKAFHEIFERKSDRNALDAARAWLGTNKTHFKGKLDNVTSVYSILEFANHKIHSRDRCQPRSLLPIAKVERKICANSYNPIKYSYTKGDNCTHLEEDENYDIVTVKNWKIEDLMECELFKVFYEGRGTEEKGNKLIHGELVGIASNLLHLEGGTKLFKECIGKNKAYSRDKYDIISYLKRSPCAPMKFTDFSPFESDRNNQFQSLSDLIRKRGKVKIIDQSAKQTSISQIEATERLNNAFDYIMSNDNNKVYLLEVATGLGKTERLKNSQGIVMAFPDNELKLEQYDSSSLKPEDKIITPSSKGLFSTAINVQIEKLFSIGRNNQVMNLIKQIASTKKSLVGIGKVTKDDIEKAKSYLDELSLVSSKASLNKTIFTTHTRAIFSEYQHETLVFDENPLQHLLEIKKVSIDDLRKFSISEGGISIIEELIANASEDECYDTPDFSDLLNRIENIGFYLDIKTNLFKFLESQFYIKEGDYIHYVLNHVKQLPKNKKIIIADATPPTQLWKNLLGDRLEIIQIKNVKYKGTVKQFTNRSCSRVGLKNYHEKIASMVGKELCLTFKDLKDYFENPCKEMHFGRVRGSNILSGLPFSVVGTPHHNNYYYKFIAKICGLEVKEFTMSEQTVKYKNKEFRFHTFEDPSLRQIHLELVEGEIIQAVDRGRLIWNDVEIKLYSNLPIDQATYTIT
ncbi:hypothetical protein [Pedobacter sp. CFBP9032]|uniref:hypothetical protein n=1 Tax=Pedobacter sp. CFBP9032 TaxID=3096539 RepID=UPI002A6A2D9B|nr:hypothetical protein [Pedobacter sp. CFBP9032]MDY0905618.1 hypothetical protein [Pedobacter sp. CFBP9032]